MLVLLPTFKPVLQQIRLLQVAKIESSSTFCNKLCKCCAFYPPKANLFCSNLRNSCVWRDSCVMLSNQKSVFTQLAVTFFFFETGLNVGGKTRNIAFQLVLHQCCKASCTFLLPVLPRLYARALFQLFSSHYRRRLREQSQNYRKKVIVVYIVHNT